MGCKRFFYTGPKVSSLMTRAQVEAGVLAIKTVADRHPGELRIAHLTDTEIVITGPHFIEDFRFEPHEFKDGFYPGLFTIVNEYNCCKTDRAHEDMVVEEILRELQAKLEEKLCIVEEDE